MVDDEPNLLSAMQELLAAEGHSVETAADGDRGYTRATSEDFDVIVTDVMMPGRNGFKLCAELRDQGVSASILVLTAKQGDFDEAEALDAGADDYLRKPFRAEVLMARIRALGRRRSKPFRADIATFGALEVNYRTRRCSVSHVEVSLTPREFSLLEVLMREPGDAVSKLDLIDGAWGSGRENAVALLQVYVGYLRKKLDVDRTSSFIATIPGFGYRLVP